MTGDMRMIDNVEGMVNGLRTINTNTNINTNINRRRPTHRPSPTLTYTLPPTPPTAFTQPTNEPHTTTTNDDNDTDFNLDLGIDTHNTYPFYLDPDNEIDFSDVFGYHYDPNNGTYSFYNDDEISNDNNDNDDDNDRWNLTQDEIDAMLHTTPGLPPNWDCFHDGDNDDDDNGYNADDWTDERGLFIP